MKHHLTITAAVLLLCSCGNSEEHDADNEGYDDGDTAEWSEEDPDANGDTLGRVDVSLDGTSTQWPGYCDIVVFESEDATTVTAMVKLTLGPLEVVSGETGDTGRVAVTAVREDEAAWQVTSLLYEAPVLTGNGESPPGWIADATMPDTAFEMRVNDAPWQAGDFEKETGSAMRLPFDARVEVSIEGNMIDPTLDRVRRGRGEFDYEGSCEITAQRVVAPAD